MILSWLYRIFGTGVCFSFSVGILYPFYINNGFTLLWGCTGTPEWIEMKYRNYYKIFITLLYSCMFTVVAFLWWFALDVKSGGKNTFVSPCLWLHPVNLDQILKHNHTWIITAPHVKNTPGSLMHMIRHNPFLSGQTAKLYVSMTNG